LPGEVAGDLGPEIGELAHSGSVEGAGLDAADTHESEAVGHFAGGAFGEGDRHDPVAPHESLVDQVCDSIGDGAGFAGASTGKNSHGAAGGGSCLLLVRV
jgi:hypothetical protein